MRLLTYEYSDPDFSGGKAVFEYWVTADDAALVTAKRANAFPLGGEEIRGRYAAQMIPGMYIDDIEQFMGKPLKTNRVMNENGEVAVTYSYVGCYGSASAVCIDGKSVILRNEAAVTDPLEAETLYEEYALPVTVSKTGGPTPEFSPILPNTPKPSPTPYIPLPSIPQISFTIILPSFIIVTPTPAPTPPVIR